MTHNFKVNDLVCFTPSGATGAVITESNKKGLTRVNFPDGRIAQLARSKLILADLQIGDKVNFIWPRTDKTHQGIIESLTCYSDSSGAKGDAYWIENMPHSDAKWLVAVETDKITKI